MRLTLSRGVSLAVLASAKTEADHHEDLGCSILGPPSRPVRKAHAWLKKQVQRLGPEAVADQAAKLVKAMEASPAYDALCDGKKRRFGRRVLRQDVIFPKAEKFKPTVLHLRRDELGLDVPMRADEWPIINDFFATLARGATKTELHPFSMNTTTSVLLDDLTNAGWLEPFTAPNTSASIVYVGHNTTLVRGKTASVLVDPYFRPASVFDLPSYQPMQPRDLGRVDAVVITHSHGDHFHLGSLLQLPRETRFFVPPVERESLFSTDCALRLRQLGFQNVEALPWWESREVGDLTVRALPFYGEQPTDQEGVHPGLRNVGSTWTIRGPQLDAAFFADSGRDVQGDMDSVCKKAGPVDVLFCGVRGFKLKPIFFGFTTLDAFLVDVPVDALTTPQQLMADGPEALRYTKLLEAKKLVPCADGGAPWYWREGMGPKYPGFPGEPVIGASPYEENDAADPYPERVKDKAALLMRPGQELTSLSKLSARSPFVWPFGSPNPQARSPQ
ncbi:MAG: MBL fold metallo-hydrolase [Archangium sp.]|nr:MBL fold metallo-hydrolase [Archangium sp.]MDP3573116.1 MBL fold metallo-hydrolase [Archangium sp.]